MHEPPATKLAAHNGRDALCLLCRVPNIWDDTKVVPPSLATGDCGHSRLPVRQFRQDGFLHVQSVLGLIENRLRVRLESLLVNLLTAMRR